MANDRSTPARCALRALMALAATASCMAVPVQAQELPISLRDSFPVGSNGLCEAQINSPEPGAGLFDRSYTIVCRDAAAPVGTLHVVRGEAGPDRFAAGSQCRDEGGDITPSALPGAQTYACGEGSGLDRRTVIASSGDRTYAATGLAVYRDALRLGLQSLATDRLAEGNVDAPLTQASDEQAFIRAQAEAISADAALNEAYRRSNAGNFAEAAEFFAISSRALSGPTATEAQLNIALQQSNLGNYAEAARLFDEASRDAGGSPVLARLARNFQAIDALNRGFEDEALAILDRPLPSAGDSDEALREMRIDGALARRLTAEQGSMLSGVGTALTPLERAQLLDGQASYLRAAALRLEGQTGGAEQALLRANSQLAEVREGRIDSILWLRAQILAELAEIEERRGQLAAAEGYHQEAIGALQTAYPGSPALLSARAQLAGLYSRTGREDEAMAIYRDMVGSADSKPAASLRRLLAPYFRLLARRSDREETAADMFAASQLLLRPGLAQTQAVLARELSAGSDEASQLFRQSLNITRAIEQLRADISQMEARLEAEPQVAAVLPERRAELEALQQRQLELQERLAEYPRYRVVDEGRMALSDLQETLRDGEAYLKLVMLDEEAYAIYAEPEGAVAYALSASPDEIDDMVTMLRDTIAIEEFGQTITYPFDIETSRRLYAALLGPVDPNLAEIDHLVFEPDGAMLRLPANLLVMDDESVNRYAERVADPAADPYDFTGTRWLGRDMQVTTSVSPSSFRDVRRTRASNAQGQYIGFGQNEPIGALTQTSSGVRGGGSMNARCQWADATWGNPIEADELRTASMLFGGGRTAILTEGEFTDTRLKQMDELDEFRILHFATHGLVTAPEPECPPSPALLTSFGDTDSDGLLTFAEIYDLRIDADLVILSACNTATAAGVAATSDAGVTGTGEFALDGLVRAFVGAGGRTVVASHWPVPDDYNATQRLVSGFFQVADGTGTASAMRDAQLGLMNDADTSHPFYWSAFAIVGDGTIPVRR